MNDLERRLRTLTDRAPAGRRELEHVLARGRVLRRRRVTLGAAAGIAVIAAAGVVGNAVLPRKASR